MTNTTNKIDIKKHYSEKINNLWNAPKFSEIQVIKRGFGIHKEVIKNSILFIGINPSFKKGSIHENYFFYMNQAGENPGSNIHPYFKKFVDISTRLDIEWSHLDLFFFRETRQRFVNELLKDEVGKSFLDEQLQISKEIILSAKPKIIVVSNTAARYFMKQNKHQISTNFEFRFDPRFGTEIIINNSKLEGTPIFFTSMLTGQRAIDRGSYNRLVWHLDFVLKQIDKAYESKVDYENKLNFLV